MERLRSFAAAPFRPGVFLWGGDVIRHGDIIYRDAWDTRGTAPYYFVALIEWVFGRKGWGLRFVDLLIQRSAAWPSPHSFRASAAVEGAGGLAPRSTCCGTDLCSLRLRAARRVDWSCGAVPGAHPCSSPLRHVQTNVWEWASARGLALLNKPAYGLFLLPPIVATLQKRLTPPKLPVKLPVTSAQQLRGAFSPSRLQSCTSGRPERCGRPTTFTCEYNVLAYGHLSTPWLPRIFNAATQLASFPMVFAVPPSQPPASRISGVLSGVYVRSLTWWLIAAVLNALVQNRPWPYEWLPAFAPLAVLAGVGTAALLTARTQATKLRCQLHPNTVRVVEAAVVLILVVGALRPAHRVARWLAHFARRTSETVYRANEFGESEIHPRQSAELPPAFAATHGRVAR